MSAAIAPPPATSSPAPQQVLRDWKEAVDRLLADVVSWSANRGWTVEHDHSVTVEEEPLGAYQLPALTVTTPEGRVHVDPKARFVLGAEGRVDLLAWPSLMCVMLLRRNGQWILRPEMGPRWPQPWNEATYSELVQLLTEE